MSGLPLRVCARCGRIGVGVAMKSWTRPDGSGCVVCADEAACRRRGQGSEILKSVIWGP